MSEITNESAAESCDYCGRKNPDGLPACMGCGTPLVSSPPANDAKPAAKSKWLAICLTVIFGPLGLFYVRAWGVAFLVMLFGVPFLFIHKGGFWIMIASRIFCSVWAYNAVVEQETVLNPRRDSARLLDEAARLESVNFSEAITAYEKIIELYPNTRAGKQAERNIETLKRHL